MPQIPQFTDDLGFISRLGDNPNTDDGLSSKALKEEFDKAPKLIQQFINSYVIPALNNYIMGNGYLPTSGGYMSGHINMQGNKITGLGEPEADSDAVTKSYAGKILPAVLPIEKGGTEAKTAEDARRNLGALSAEDLKAKSVDGVDMNTVKASGKYYGSTMTNAGESGNSVFDVEVYSEGWLTQTQKRIADDGTVRLYIRSFYNGTAWSPWRPILTNILPDSMLSAEAPDSGVRNQLHFVEVE